MKIVVIGGSGLIGSRLVGRLRQGGHFVVAASPSTGVNTVTGDGLPEAMEDAQVVIDVANSPSFEGAVAWDFFFTSCHNLFAAESAAGVRHHLALSVVGTDHLLDSGYFRAKYLQEQLIAESGVPYTILRATQFFEFMGGIAASSTQDRIVRLPPALTQPVAADDVAETLAQLAVRPPANGRLELAGPQPYRLSDVVDRVLAVNHDERLVISDPSATYFGIRIDERALIPGPGQPFIGAIGLDDWLARNHLQTT
ncbi:MAG: NmrA family transcriptional regulator [Pelagibacterium sp. SCN 64-44]|mgnify:CR=1 FL=1|nr:MAG: NmrA family transcriptional regulator [Pelagibacterium sp. SCN 64-44]